jgi:hypothetical protein
MKNAGVDANVGCGPGTIESFQGTPTAGLLTIIE